MSGPDQNRIIQCCIQKTKQCLETVYSLLDQAGVDPFYLDDNGLSGLDYLLMPDSDGHDSRYFLVSYRIYTDLLVKYIKLYYENNPNDPVLNRNLQKICTNPALFEALEQPLRRDLKLLLHTYCKPATATDANPAQLITGAYAEAEEPEDPEGLTKVEPMQYGHSEAVPAERTYVTEDEEEQYVRQPLPDDLRAYREAEKRGGFRKKRTNKKSNKKTNKRSNKKSNKRSSNKRTNKRRTRKA